MMVKKYKRMEVGVTFSHKHIKDLGLDLQESLAGLKLLKIKWVRLCCYWNEIEEVEGTFDYSTINKIVNYCELNKMKIVFSVGMKAPRFPEYYIPKWADKKSKLIHGQKIVINNKYLLKKTLNFIKLTVTQFMREKTIKVWQVENEPLDPSGNSWMSIDEQFLKNEVGLVRSLDKSRKIMVNLWGNELGVRKLYKKAIELVDIVGIDLYLRQPTPLFKIFHKFIGPLDSKKEMLLIVNEIKNAGRQLFIAELQAEPWEPNEIVTNKINPRSFLPKHLKENIKYVEPLNPNVILLWGYEYWIWRKANGDRRYWDEALNYFTKK